MEILMMEATNVPADHVVSIRLGDVRRQAPLDRLRQHALRFPRAACAEPVRIEVMKVVAAARLALQPGEDRHYQVSLSGKDAGAAKLSSNTGCAMEAASGPMTFQFRTRSISDQKGISEHGGSAGSRSLSAMSATSAVAESSDGLFGSAGAIKTPKYVDAAAAARDYLQGHGILQYIQASLPFLWLFPDSRFLAPLLPPILTVECVRNAGGLGLVRQTAPLGFAVALCVAAKSVTSSLPPPWDGFQPSSAIVTILLLMETGITLERLLIKATQRIAGTCIGGMLAVASALILDQASHDRAVVASLFFAVFTSCAALQKNHSPVSYLFTVVSLTYSLVFYGFVNNGWPFLAGRLVSVFVGEVLSVLSSLGFDLVCRDPRIDVGLSHFGYL
ncbi:unnamed protein product [Polarella glacialis]|uniref:Integral membrane bound transporter domain-containing protein n=1 Tax=Polarella glacialis TaxID=89957 RepID=A0A813GM06_POLGL|nr:unnamed protein product [Polarella glacialis]